MSQNGKSQKILFLFATLLISGDTDAAVCPQQPVSITVVFNSFNVEQPNTRPVLIKKSFEEIPSLLRLGVSFVYKNLNSTFCDLGSFLSFVSGILSCDLVVLLLDDCKCEETFVMYLNILSIKVVSHCIAPYFTVSGTL